MGVIISLYTYSTNEYIRQRRWKFLCQTQDALCDRNTT